MASFADEAYHGIIARSAVPFVMNERFTICRNRESVERSRFRFSRPDLLPAEGRRRGLATIGASNRPRATRLCVARRPGGAIAPTAAIYEKPAQHPTAAKRTRQNTSFVPRRGRVVRCPPRTIQQLVFCQRSQKGFRCWRKTTTCKLHRDRHPPTDHQVARDVCDR